MKTFEFKSAICTSREQSEKLLELGLKKETADMAHQPDANVVCKYDVWYRSEIEDNFFPAWSLHRLMLIANANDTVFLNIENMYETLIKRIASNIKWGFINKDYLEEKL